LPGHWSEAFIIGATFSDFPPMMKNRSAGFLTLETEHQTHLIRNEENSSQSAKTPKSTLYLLQTASIQAHVQTQKTFLTNTESSERGRNQ
jgi:hypothetical protein